jgi:YfiH family protein
VIRKKHNHIDWLEFEQLQEFSNLKHGIFLCHGGVSPKPFQSLNAGGSTGDDPVHVEENRRRILSLFPSGKLISVNQAHTANVHVVEGLYTSNEACDGLITKEKHQALMIKHADCQAAIFYDPVEKILANVHSGWRGNVQNIYAVTIEAMKKMGSNPANILVCISPSLGPSQSEFVNYRTEFPAPFHEFQWKENYFNLWEISRMQLQASGVLPSHIECAEICTYENKQDYFSYRREKITGRNSTLAMLH